MYPWQRNLIQTASDNPGAVHSRELLADKRYDSDWFRKSLTARGIAPCRNKVPLDDDKTLYRQCHKMENIFGKLKDRRRIHTRYDRCAHSFFSAICIAASVIFYLNQ